MLDLLYVFGAAMALFLVGANIAFLMNLGRLLTGWFVLKIVAIDLLMIYMACSMFYGNPALWRACIGLLALLVDVFALGYMWYGIEKLRAAGVTGLIPIARLDTNGHGK